MQAKDTPGRRTGVGRHPSRPFPGRTGSPNCTLVHCREQAYSPG